MEIFFIQRAVLGRLGDLLFGDGFLSFEVGDGSGNLEDAVVAARGKRELIEDSMEELVGRRRKSAMPTDQLAGEVGVAGDAGSLISFPLNLTGPIDALFDFSRAFSPFLPG